MPRLDVTGHGSRPFVFRGVQLGRPFFTHLAVCCAGLMSIIACLATWDHDVAAFAHDNYLDPGRRSSVRNAVLMAATAPVGLAALAGLVWPARARDAVMLAGKWLAPFIVAYPVRSLAGYAEWSRQDALYFLVLLTVVVLIFERSLQFSFAEFREPGRLARFWERRHRVLREGLPLFIVVVMAATYAQYTSYWSIQNHQRLATYAYDLGIYDNLMFNCLEGRWYESTVMHGPEGGSSIAGHAELTIPFFLPLYALSPRAETMLMLQSAMIGFAAVPLYLFARTLLPASIAVLLAACYLLYAPMHGANFYDFHWLPTAVFFYFWLFYGIAKNWAWIYVPAFIMLVLTREDVSVGLAVLGVFLFATGIRPRMGVIMAIAAVISFALIKFGLMMAVGYEHFGDRLYPKLMGEGERGMSGLATTVTINPMYVLSTLLVKDKLIYALHLFAPLAFVPMRRAAFAFLCAAGFAFTLLTTDFPPTISIAFQYVTHWVPPLFGALVLYLVLRDRAHGRGAQLATAMAVVLGVVLHSLNWGAVLQRDGTFKGGFRQIPFASTEEEDQAYLDLQAMVANIPPDASVAATERLVPHVSNRLDSFALRSHHGNAEFLFLQKRGVTKNRVHIQAALEEAEYGVVDQRGDMILLRKDHENPQSEQIMRAFGLRAKPPRKPTRTPKAKPKKRPSPTRVEPAVDGAAADRARRLREKNKDEKKP